MLDIVPDTDRLAQVFSLAAAPAFFLGACIALISQLLGRLSLVMEQLRQEDAGNASAIALQLKRARLLNSSIKAAMGASLCTLLLLIISFAAAFFRLTHAYGAGLLFALAAVLLIVALIRYAQEVLIAQKELENYPS
jgi:Ca2+/Na+ antiporter